jgi:tetratricopeptide (TPR) repeat protein
VNPVVAPPAGDGVSAQSPTQAAAGSGSSAADIEAAASAAHEPVDAAARIPDPAAANGTNATRQIGKPDDRLRNSKRPPVKPAPARPSVATADDAKNPTALVKQAKAFERNGQWDEARSAYQRLEKIKGYRNEALYHQAWAAFQTNDTAVAAQLAGQVATEAGPFQVQAKFLYADALYRQAEYDRAKELYKLLRTQLHGDDRATATKKIVACNKALKLPDGDGIHD